MKKIVLSLVTFLSLAHGEFVRDDTKEVIVDTETGLMWQDNSEVGTVEKNWQGAIEYCQNLRLGGFSDWRLPDKETLQALYRHKAALHNVRNDWYWSSSPVVSANDYAWNVGFDNGGDGWYYKDANYYVRCVRDSHRPFDTLSLFLDYINTSEASQESVTLSRVSADAEFFTVTHNGKTYKGTKEQILAQLRNVLPYYKTPFASVQTLTQHKLNAYLSLPLVPHPTLPPALNLTKDEFESKAEFSERVKSESAKREAEIARLQEEYRQKVQARNNDLESRKANIQSMQKIFLFSSFREVMGEPQVTAPVYDAETKTMYVSVSMSNADWSKKVGIAMPEVAKAKAFKEGATQAMPKVTFGYENGAFVLKSIDVAFNGETLVAVLSDKDYKPERVAVTLENKKIAFNELQNPNLTDTYRVAALGYSESGAVKGVKYDDDLTPLIKKLPKVKEDKSKWLFVVGVENYKETDKIPFSKNSAESFKLLIQKKLGISERNTYALIDESATGSQIEGKLSLMLQNVKEGDTVYFYYNGHGVPDQKSSEAYILPSDEIVDFITKKEQFKFSNIYKQLESSKASKVLAVIDSCFSGRGNEGQSLFKGTAGAVVRTKKFSADEGGKVAILTAGSESQFSNGYEAKGHRLLSYFVMRSLLEGKTSLNDIYLNSVMRVKEVSSAKGDTYIQEPQILGNKGLGL